jgi:hypothetical protein
MTTVYKHFFAPQVDNESTTLDGYYTEVWRLTKPGAEETATCERKMGHKVSYLALLP